MQYHAISNIGVMDSVAGHRSGWRLIVHKTVDWYDDMNYYDCAIKGFDRSNIAVIREEQEARVFKNGIRFSKAKVSSLKFRFVEHVTNAALKASGFFVAVLPTIYSEPLIMQGCRKANCIKAGVSPLPLIGYTDSTNHHNTHFATTAASNGYNDNSAKPEFYDERWGGGFIQPIAYKQDSLVKVAITVCGN